MFTKRDFYLILLRIDFIISGTMDMLLISTTFGLLVGILPSRPERTVMGDRGLTKRWRIQPAVVAGLRRFLGTASAGPFGTILDALPPTQDSE